MPHRPCEGAQDGWKRPGRAVTEEAFPFHAYAFREELIHTENVGGDIELMLNTRANLGAFPRRYDGLEACPCRIVRFEGRNESVEAVGGTAKAVLGPRRIAAGLMSGGPDDR